MDMTIESPAFEQNGEIPAVYTCDGRDISPALKWAGVPAGTESLVLIVDDPDAPDPAAPKMTWVHWVLYNLPPDVDGLPEAVGAEGLPKGTREGHNDWKRSADWQTSLFPQALCTRHRPAGPGGSDESRGGAGDAGACARPGRADRHLPTLIRQTAGGKSTYLN